MLRLNVLYRGIAKCSLGDGSTILFYEELWCLVVFAQTFPNLFLVSVLNLPLSQQAYDKLIDMQDLISTIPYDPDSNDHESFL